MADNRGGLIEAVKTPLAFLTLALLIAEVIVLSMLTVEEIDRNSIVSWAGGVFLFFLVVVVFLAWLRPEALSGNRPLEKTHAENFAHKLYLAFDGAIRNNPDAEQLDAWRTSSELLAPSRGDDEVYAKFLGVVSGQLKVIYKKRFQVEE